MSIKKVNQAFIFTQDYRRENQLPAPDDFPMFSESFSIGKISVEETENISINNLLIQPYFFRSKIPAENPIALALVLANESLEKKLNDGLNKLVDVYKGTFDPTPVTSIERIQSRDTILNFPYRIAYSEVREFELISLDENYPLNCSQKLVNDQQVVDLFLVQAGVVQSPVNTYIENTNKRKFLYIIPFLPKLQKTQLAVSGRISFNLEF